MLLAGRFEPVSLREHQRVALSLESCSEPPFPPLFSLAGTDVLHSQINDAINSYSRMKAMHTWLRERHARGESMPKNQNDAQTMMQSDMAQGKTAINDAQKALMKNMKSRAARR